MVSPSPTPSPRTGQSFGAPPALLIPADADELDKEHDSFPDISARRSLSSHTLAPAPFHQRKSSLRLAPSSAAVTYQLSAQPLQSAPVQSERQAFLANAALRSTFIRQGSLQRLSTLRGGAQSSLLNSFHRPPLPIAVRQETGSLTRQPTVRFATAAPAPDVISSDPQRSTEEPTEHRLPSYVPIVQVADSFVYRAEVDADERCQHGYEVMPVLSTLLEQQISDVGATDGRACLHVVVKAPQQQETNSSKKLLFYTKAPSEDDFQLLESQSLASIESSLLACFAPPAPVPESDTDDENGEEFFYTDAQNADESSDDEDSDDNTRATHRPSKHASPHASKPASTRASTSQPTAATRQPAALPPIPVQRPTCCICTSVELVDPWLSACGHVCCGECWVAWLMEQSESGDSLAGGGCAECGRVIDLEELKRVVTCDRCAKLCVAGAGLHWTHAACHHTCCLQCWRGQLASTQTCPVCDIAVDAALFPVD